MKSLGLATPALAATNIFMSISSTQGSSKGDEKSPYGSQWIPVLQFNQSVVSPRDNATGQASGKRQHETIKVVKVVDASSPQLQRAAVTREHLKEVVFEFYRPNGKGTERDKAGLYQTIRLTDAIITIQKNGPTEEISFNYEKIEITYAQQKQPPATVKPSPAKVKPSAPVPR